MHSPSPQGQLRQPVLMGLAMGLAIDEADEVDELVEPGIFWFVGGWRGVERLIERFGGDLELRGCAPCVLMLLLWLQVVT